MFEFKHIEKSELVDLLLLHPLDDPERNEKMVDTFIQAMEADCETTELESMKDYLEIKKSFYTVDELNIQFVKRMLGSG